MSKRPDDGSTPGREPLQHPTGFKPPPPFAATSTHVLGDALLIAETPGKGRGVFAARAFAAGEIIDTSPVVPLSAAESANIDGSILDYYVFDWTPDGCFALALGAGSLFNHSFRPNIVYEKRFAERLIVFRALRDIEAGEELKSNYNGDPEEREPLWYPTVDD